MKIFWSWQSDTPGKFGRHLIRDALRDAVDRLKKVADIEEPVREALHLDQDIQDVPGSPDLARTIFDKIDTAAVVVADVTLVGKVDVQGGEEKRLINSNVAIELGYALRSLSDRYVVLVFNQHYGKHEDLPFDLRHKGGAIVFDIPPSADRETIRAQQKVLADRFVGALRPYVENAVVRPASFAGTQSTFSKAAYFAKGDVLATAGERGPNEITYSYDGETFFYARFVPANPIADSISLPKLRRAALLAPLLSSYPQDRTVADLNNFGAIRVRPGSHPKSGPATIDSSTQLFETGEIWSISVGLIRSRPGNGLPIIHSVGFELVFYEVLKSIVAFAEEHLSVEPPWQVELGVVGVQSLDFGVIGQDSFLYSHPLLKAEIVSKRVLKRDESIDDLLLGFFSKVHDATGSERPAGYRGFPPNRPGSAPR